MKKHLSILAVGFLCLLSAFAQPAAPNYVLSLGGTNGFLELPSGAFNDLEEVTIEVWVKWMDDRQWRKFFDFGKEWSSIRVQGVPPSWRFLESFDVRFPFE